MKLLLVPLALTTVALAALALPGCAADTYGVGIENKTGQLLNVTYLDVGNDGATKPYAAATLAKNGTFTHQVQHDQQGFGKRVRFSIPDRSADDPTSNLELKLSDEKVRDYDLKIVNGRLVAQEWTKQRPEYRPAD